MDLSAARMAKMFSCTSQQSRRAASRACRRARQCSSTSRKVRRAGKQKTFRLCKAAHAFKRRSLPRSPFLFLQDSTSVGFQEHSNFIGSQHLGLVTLKCGAAVEVTLRALRMAWDLLLALFSRARAPALHKRKCAQSGWTARRQSVWFLVSGRWP